MTEGAKSVIIYRGLGINDLISENIYYVGQTNDAEGFSNLEMLMKFDVPAGIYTILVDGGAKTTFRISDASSYNKRVAGIVGSNPNKNNGATLNFENITVDNSNSFNSLWGTWDCATAGILGKLEANSYFDNTKTCVIGGMFEKTNNVLINNPSVMVSITSGRYRKQKCG